MSSLTPRTTSDSPPHRARLVPTTATALVSLLAVGLATTYLVAPTRTALAVAIQVDAAAVVPAGKVVIYGKATDRGNPLAGVRISARRAGRTTVVATSGAKGTFRKASSLRSGSYVVLVSRKSKGKTRTARVGVRLRSGRAYRVTIRLVRNGGLSILPIRSY